VGSVINAGVVDDVGVNIFFVIAGEDVDVATVAAVVVFHGCFLLGDGVIV
jgi:hypothetical protein